MNTPKNKFQGQLFTQRDLDNGIKPTQKRMTFSEVLESEHKHLIEQLEWGCSDPQIIEMIKAELEEKTGYVYPY